MKLHIKESSYISKHYDYIDYSFYRDKEDVVENIRDILDMCETKTEKY